MDELFGQTPLHPETVKLHAVPGGSTDLLFANGGLTIDYAAGCACLDGEELHLTPYEYKLLCLLAHNVERS